MDDNFSEDDRGVRLARLADEFQFETGAHPEACAQSPVWIFVHTKAFKSAITTNAAEIRAQFKFNSQSSLMRVLRDELSTCAAACMKRSRTVRGS